jgi:predicted phosphoribosyltransferase
MPLPFRDRVEAGQELGGRLADRLRLEDAVVLGLPRGGVPVAAEVAAVLGASLDVLVVRKLGAPGQPELAMGAIATGGVRYLNDAVVEHLGISPAAIDEVAQRELSELARREREYRGDRSSVRIAGRTLVLVDDGLATGATMRAAVEAVRSGAPSRVVVAVPVGAPESCRLIEEVADEVVCLHSPSSFGAVGAFYVDFDQTTDDEVRRLLDTQVGQ